MKQALAALAFIAGIAQASTHDYLIATCPQFNGIPAEVVMTTDGDRAVNLSIRNFVTITDSTVDYPVGNLMYILAGAGAGAYRFDLTDLEDGRSAQSVTIDSHVEDEHVDGWISSQTAVELTFVNGEFQVLGHCELKNEALLQRLTRIR